MKKSVLHETRRFLPELRLIKWSYIVNATIAFVHRVDTI